MSISENTEKINQLITKINDLPSAAPTVRRVESSFVNNPVNENLYGEDSPVVYVDCGFKPDVVLFTDFHFSNDPESYVCQFAFVLSELPADDPDTWALNGMNMVMDENRSYTIMGAAQPTDTGFKLLNFGDQGGLLINAEINYVAIKYT